MKKLLILVLMILLVSITASCTKILNIHNKDGDVKDSSKAHVITLDEQNRVIHLNFEIANMDLLDDYIGEDISTATALCILEEDVYVTLPVEVQEELDAIKWTWNKGATVAKGIIAY